MLAKAWRKPCTVLLLQLSPAGELVPTAEPLAPGLGVGVQGRARCFWNSVSAACRQWGSLVREESCRRRGAAEAAQALLTAGRARRSQQGGEQARAQAAGCLACM